MAPMVHGLEAKYFGKIKFTYLDADDATHLRFSTYAWVFLSARSLPARCRWKCPAKMGRIYIRRRIRSQCLHNICNRQEIRSHLDYGALVRAERRWSSSPCLLGIHWHRTPVQVSRPSEVEASRLRLHLHCTIRTICLANRAQVSTNTQASARRE